MPHRTTPTPSRPQRRWASIAQTAEHLSKSERTVYIDLNEVDDTMRPFGVNR